MTDIFIKKFKLLKDKGCEIITITDQFSNTEKETKITIKEDLHDDIFQAMQKLCPIVREIAELPDDYPKGGALNVRGISWTMHEELSIKGACITALADLTTSNAPLVINTPHLPFEPYSEPAGDYMPPTFPSHGLHLLRAIEDEILLIIDGKRADNDQGSLF